MSQRLRESLSLLKRLNEARRIGQTQAADMLDEQLDEHDDRCGYKKRRTAPYFQRRMSKKRSPR